MPTLHLTVSRPTQKTEPIDGGIGGFVWLMLLGKPKHFDVNIDTMDFYAAEVQAASQSQPARTTPLSPK